MKAGDVLKLAAALFIFTACAPVPAAEPTPQPTLAQPAPQEEAVSGAVLWREVRNERFGFGIAVPCWWEITPMPADGVISSMTIRSFDEAFFAANSEKGVWLGGVPPQGAVSMDITAATGMDPSVNITDSYAQLVDGTLYSIIHSQERTIGENLFTVITLQNLINENEAPSVVHVSGLSPDTILIFSVYPVDAIRNSDVQAILASYAGTSAEAINLPKIPPQPALTNKACPF